jgi:sialic acid synthase SpsE
LLACCALGACASAPAQEMSNARQAIRAAREAGAEQVAPQQYMEARLHLEQAEASLQSRNYREARRQAVAARGKAVEALSAARAAARPDSG